MKVKNISGTPTEILDAIVGYGCSHGNSDIHIDPGAHDVRVRCRKDGVLQLYATYSLLIHEEVIRRLKILARIRTDDSFNTRDGRFSLSVGESKFDIRTVTTPSYFGESVTLRVLRPLDISMSLESLGFNSEDALDVINHARFKTGAILVTGPTGSGKTSTLYAILSNIANASVSAITLEDPIEYVFESVRQIQVSADRSLSFSSVLRSVLRQDPDIILVGEMRDAETARISISASLTGHVLLSTMHTRSATGAVSRLLEMGIERYFISSAVAMVISQRLLRRLCESCKHTRLITSVEEELFTEHGVYCQSISEPVGCEKCDKTGYAGRTCVYEILKFSRSIYSAITSNVHEDEIRDTWISEGGKTIRQNALTKCAEGIVSLDEVLSLGTE
jgi:type II secretory ATPase GspE/PulE/Tfp pilus assembly ATPase PilB-like protein